MNPNTSATAVYPRIVYTNFLLPIKLTLHYALVEQLTMCFMYVEIVACTLCLIGASVSAESTSNCTGCIIVNKTGYDRPSCLWRNSTTPCKTLSYVLSLENLNNREVVLQGDHWITSTLTVSGVDGLTIRSSDHTNATIYCRVPSSINDIGSGLVFESASNIKILNVMVKRCGTLQYSTTVRNSRVWKYRSAVYIINSTNVTFSGSRFDRSVGRGLSMYDVYGYVQITRCKFVGNAVLEEEEMQIFGGGGVFIQFTRCPPGYIHCNPRDNVHNYGSYYEFEDCVFQDNRVTDNETLPKIVQYTFRFNSAGRGGGIGVILEGFSLNNNISIANCKFYNNSARYGGGVYVRLFNYAQKSNVAITNCQFETNSAVERSGGALTIGHISQPDTSGNIVTVQNTSFSENKALWGGAVNIFVTRKSANTKNHITFFNCTWLGNSATLGAAMMIKRSFVNSIFNDVFPIQIISGSFINNQVITSADFLITSVHNIATQHVAEIGVLDVNYVTVEFSNFFFCWKHWKCYSC